MYPAIESDAFDLPLMARKRTATLLYSTEEVLTVLEFFAVGDLSTAVLLRAVKGGVNLPQTNISAIFKVHLSLFLIAQFFITQLTLPLFIRLLQLYTILPVSTTRKRRKNKICFPALSFYSCALSVLL